MVSFFHLFRQRLMVPLQLFLGVFILGELFSVPKIEANLTEQTRQILQRMELPEVHVNFIGPVAVLSGKVPDAETKRQLIEKVSHLESLWGLRVESQQALVVVAPSLPVSYRLDFAHRSIKVSGEMPSELKKNALLAKVRALFPEVPRDGVMDQLVAHAQDAEITSSEAAGQGFWSNLLEMVPKLKTMHQLRWVTVEDGNLTISANVPSSSAAETLTKEVQQLDPHSAAEDLKVIAMPSLDVRISPFPQFTLSGTVANEAAQTTAAETLQKLFPKAKITSQCELDERVGPVEWILPLLRPLPSLQKLGKLSHIALVEPMPLVEAEVSNVSAQITMTAAIEDAYHKNVKANLTLFTPEVHTITPPSLWVEMGEEESAVTGIVANEEGRKLLLTKLGSLLPNVKLKDAITLNPNVAPTRLYAPVLDPMIDIPSLEPTFILQGFGIVDGRLKFTGLVPETAAKDRLTGVILKRHTGKVRAEVTVDSSYLPDPDASWTATFGVGKLTVQGQLSTKQIRRELATDLQATYPGWEIDNQAEVLPSGLRKRGWADYLTGLLVVAAPAQTTSLTWQHETLTLSARVPDDRAKTALEKRLQRTYGNAISSQIAAVPDPLLQDLAAVQLIDCTIYFEATQRDFIAQEIAKLQQVVEVLERHPDVKLSIEAHTDDKGSATVNLNLSQARADAVLKWLIRRKIDPARIVAKGFGERRPVASFKTEAGRAACRRLEFRVR